MLFYIGIIILVIAALLDILVYDQVTKTVKPQVYWLGLILAIVGYLR